MLNLANDLPDTFGGQLWNMVLES